ncbi:MAG: elongation factor P lysine(34) lysyltransferase, partial [Colwellia sp.]|nr:elongation factor P lysine(34) lysyltransferase [Colwellia sp.]
ESSRSELIAVIEQNNKLEQWLIDEPDNDILLQFIFSEIIEVKIGLSVPCFIYNFPKTQASLAKISPTDSRVAERFECYFQGLEMVLMS